MPANYHWYDSPLATLQTQAAVDTTAGVWLAGTGAPPSGSGLNPLDGVNDPWRWMPSVAGWVGPAYELTLTGTEEFVPSALPNPEGMNGQLGPLVNLVAIAARTAVGYLSAPPLFADHYADGSDPGEGRPQPTPYWSEEDPGSTVTFRTFRAVGPTTGIAFLVQLEPGFGGPTSPSFPDLDVRDVLTGLGLSAGEPFQFDETAALGTDGQFYLDRASRAVHLRVNGTWTRVATLPAPS